MHNTQIKSKLKKQRQMVLIPSITNIEDIPTFIVSNKEDLIIDGGKILDSIGEEAQIIEESKTETNE